MINAINIIGPKGCGKTRTAKERCKTIIEFQDEEKRDGYLAVAETSPKLLFKNLKPILFDETGVNKIPEAESSLLRFKDVIVKHNEEALSNPQHPKALYREPSALIVICATAPMGYTTDAGVKIVPIGCLKD